MNKKSIIISISIIICAVFLMAIIKISKDRAVISGNEFPISQYINSPQSFAGNVYSLNAQIDSQLAYNDVSGRMFLVKSYDSTPLPVYAPHSLSGFNPMVGQKYKFAIRIAGDGMLTLTSFEKI